MNKILITISEELVTIYDNGTKCLSFLSDWDGNTKEEILEEYKISRQKLRGGEIFE